VNGLSAIVGQERAVARLRRALRSGRPHHAYLFDGPEGVGKRTTALALAQAWSCERHPGEGCGECEPCRKIDAGVHPDVFGFEVLPEKGQTDRVRALIPRLGYAPNEGRVRVVIVDPAEELNLQASNVLLKTLEEPPPRTQFVLITPIASALLTTIRSRCQRLPFQALPEPLLAEHLVSAHGVDAASATALAALAGGSLGRALALSYAEELPRRRERTAKLLASAHGGQAHALLDAAAELAGDRDEAEATLDLLWVTYRDAVLLAEGLGEGRVATARAGDAAPLATVPTASLLIGLHAVEEAREAIRGYVSPQLALEHLLIRLADARAA
jgi:DNA polymerase-3 subunit delta'